MKHVKTFTLAPLLVIGALLSGCASLAPDYQRPASPVPEVFPQAIYPTQAAADAKLAGDIPWRDYFTEPRLREVIAQALDNNRDLRVAALNIAKARAQYQIQRADAYPSIAANASYSAQRLPGDLSGFGQATTSRQYGIDVGTTSWELDFFGRIRSLSDEAMQQYLATEAAQRSTQISLIAEVAQAWLDLAADRERLALSTSTFETRAKSRELIRRTVEIGTATLLDLRQAETLLESARADRARDLTQVARDENTLTLLVGAPVRAEQLPAALGERGIGAVDLTPGLPSEVLLRRPDIVQAEHTLRGANANIGAARAAFFPSITLTATAGTASSALDGMFGNGAGISTLMPQIRIPIFEAGRLQASLDVAEIQRDINVAQYEKAIQTAFREVADALADKATLNERLDAGRKLVQAAADSQRLSEARYNSGIDDYLVLLDAQRTLFSAQRQLIDERQAEAVNRVVLYKVLGGGDAIGTPKT